MKQFFQVSLVSVAVLLSCCTHKQIVTAQEAETFMHPSPNIKLKLIKEDIGFWSARLGANKEDLPSQLKLAGLYSRQFQYSGNIDDIKKSDSLYLEAHRLQKNFGSGTYRSLAANCITQHRFREANAYLDTAYQMGDDKYFTLLQQFDVSLELGDIFRAASILKMIYPKNSFEYLLRNAKLLDHKGDAAASIKNMEQALVKAEESKNEDLVLWAKTNLADMYGHHNLVNKSYQLYKEVLKQDRHNFHALKGIAWIAYSFDRNPAIAKKIIFYLQQQHPVPDYDYLLAQIATYEKDNTAAKKYNRRFLNEAADPLYGNMYNKYVFDIICDEKNEAANSLEIAQTEIKNRPTAQSYSMLAWALYKAGRLAEAIKIADEKIAGKNFEPGAMYELGIIYKAGGYSQRAKKYLAEAAHAGFELGPVLCKRINEERSTL